MIKSKNLGNIYSHHAIIFYRTLETEYIKRVMKNIPIKSPSLDLGCGDGKITNYLFGKTFDYGLDNDEIGDVKEAFKNKIYKKILIEDATKISLKNNSVNFIFSNSVLEHIPNLERVLSESSRILNKNGYFLIAVPSNNFKKNLLFSNPIYVYLRNKMLSHHHLYDIKKWTVLLKKYHLKVIKYEYCISKEQLQYWDMLAIINRLIPIFGLRNKIQIKFLIPKTKIKSGSNLIILAKKI